MSRSKITRSRKMAQSRRVARSRKNNINTWGKNKKCCYYSIIVSCYNIGHSHKNRV